MHEILNSKKMFEATRLTRAGRLNEATALLQRMLSDPDITFNTGDIVHPGQKPPTINATVESKKTDRPPASRFGIDGRPAGLSYESAATTAQPRSFRRLNALRIETSSSGVGLHGLVQPAPVSKADILPEGGRFIEASYNNPAGSRAYKLYIPSRYHGQALPFGGHAARLHPVT